MLGSSVGAKTLPILASIPIPLVSTWVHMAQVHYALMKSTKCCNWSHFSASTKLFSVLSAVNIMLMLMSEACLSDGPFFLHRWPTKPSSLLWQREPAGRYGAILPSLTMDPKGIKTDLPPPQGEAGSALYIRNFGNLLVTSPDSCLHSEGYIPRSCSAALCTSVGVSLLPSLLRQK